jgi:hypothetical protein
MIVTGTIGTVGTLAAVAMASRDRGFSTVFVGEDRSEHDRILDVPVVPLRERETRYRRIATKSRFGRSSYVPHFGKRQAARLARNIELGRIPADQRI